MGLGGDIRIYPQCHPHPLPHAAGAFAQEPQLAGALPLRRLGAPREIGDLVAFLSSDRGAYITGAVIPVDGGLTRSLL